MQFNVFLLIYNTVLFISSSYQSFKNDWRIKNNIINIINEIDYYTRIYWMSDKIALVKKIRLFERYYIP